MKLFLLLFFLPIILVFTSSTTYAEITVPVYYWQLIDQDRYIYRSDMDQLSWRDIRKQRELSETANHDPKFLSLNLLDLDSAIHGLLPVDGNMLDTSIALMRDPNGEIQQVSLSAIANQPHFVKIPLDDDLTGRYLLGIHITSGGHDIDKDGDLDAIHICAKHIISHYRNGGKVGSASVIFFDDAQQMPFEIAPAIDTAKSRYGGGIQSTHRSYEMIVRYMDKPLAGAKVTVISSESRWQKSFITDNKGRFRVMPTDDRLIAKEWQNYLYVATHHDLEHNAYYLTTLPVMVYKNRPEWSSKAMGFTYWAIIGSALSLLMVVGLIRRDSWYNSRSLTIFENHRIKKN